MIVDELSLLPSSAGQVCILFVISSMLLMFISALCVTGCKDKKRRRRKKKSTSSGHANGSCVTDKTVDIEKSGENGRILGHDRALPEIPATASRVASTDDDDEEVEGHYDVISKSHQMALQTTSAVPVAGTSRMALHPANGNPPLRRGNHPYEIVHGEPDSESATYAGIPDSFIQTSNMMQHRAIDMEVTGQRSDPLYAGISDDGCSSDSVSGAVVMPSNASVAAIYSTVGKRTYNKDVLKAGAVNGANDNAGAFAGSVTVQDRHFEVVDSIDGLDEVTAFSVSSSVLPVHSTNTTEAISWGANGTASVSNHSVISSSPTTSSGLWGVGSVVHPVSVEPAGDSLQQQQNSSTPVSTDAVSLPVTSTAVVTEAEKRVPNYSSLTARESLDNIRRRQQLILQSAQPIGTARATVTDIGAVAFVEVDGTYDTIDYDAIRPSNNADLMSRSMPPLSDNQVYNNGSDLYAEIGTGPSSSRSSTYARVGDLVTSSNEQAPVPPSVDALQQLTHYVVANANDDNIVDPGYSRVDRPRPHSAHITSSHQSIPAATASVTRGRRSPVYAVISKPSKRPTTTVCNETDGAAGGSEVPLMGNHPGHCNGVNGLSVSALYSQVVRPGHHRRTMSNEAAVVHALTTTTTFDLRPYGISCEVRHSSERDDVSFGRNFNGYASIDGNPVGAMIQPLPDSDYDVVGEPVMDLGQIDYDPNYETVPPIRPTMRNGDSNVQPFGVAREIVMSSPSIDRHAIRGTNSYPESRHRSVISAPPLIREHIYQEVTSNGLVSRPYLTSANEQHHTSRNSGHSGTLSTDL